MTLPTPPLPVKFPDVHNLTPPVNPTVTPPTTLPEAGQPNFTGIPFAPAPTTSDNPLAGMTVSPSISANWIIENAQNGNYQPQTQNPKFWETEEFKTYINQIRNGESYYDPVSGKYVSKPADPFAAAPLLKVEKPEIGQPLYWDTEWNSPTTINTGKPLYYDPGSGSYTQGYSTSVIPAYYMGTDYLGVNGAPAPVKYSSDTVYNPWLEKGDPLYHDPATSTITNDARFDPVYDDGKGGWSLTQTPYGQAKWNWDNRLSVSNPYLEMAPNSKVDPSVKPGDPLYYNSETNTYYNTPAPQSTHAPAHTAKQGYTGAWQQPIETPSEAAPPTWVPVYQDKDGRLSITKSTEFSNQAAYSVPAKTLDNPKFAPGLQLGDALYLDPTTNYITNHVTNFPLYINGSGQLAFASQVGADVPGHIQGNRAYYNPLTTGGSQVAYYSTSAGMVRANETNTTPLSVTSDAPLGFLTAIANRLGIAPVLSGVAAFLTSGVQNIQGLIQRTFPGATKPDTNNMVPWLKSIVDYATADQPTSQKMTPYDRTDNALLDPAYVESAKALGHDVIEITPAEVSIYYASMSYQAAMDWFKKSVPGFVDYGTSLVENRGITIATVQDLLTSSRDNLNLSHQQRDQAWEARGVGDYQGAEELLYQAIVNARKAGGESGIYDPFATWTEAISPEMEDNFLHAAAQVEAQLGRELTDPEIKQLRDHFVNPWAEMAGNSIVDLTNLLFMIKPVNTIFDTIVKWPFTKLGEGVSWTLGKAAESKIPFVAVAGHWLGDASTRSVANNLRSFAYSVFSSVARDKNLDTYRAAIDEAGHIVPDLATKGTGAGVAASVMPGVFGARQEGMLFKLSNILGTVPDRFKNSILNPGQWASKVDDAVAELYDAELKHETERLIADVSLTDAEREAVINAVDRTKVLAELDRTGLSLDEIAKVEQRAIKQAESDAITTARIAKVEESAKAWAAKFSENPENIATQMARDYQKAYVSAFSKYPKSGLFKTYLGFLDWWSNQVLSMRPAWVARNLPDTYLRAILNGVNPFKALDLLGSGLVKQLRSEALLFPELTRQLVTTEGDRYGLSLLQRLLSLPPEKSGLNFIDIVKDAYQQAVGKELAFRNNDEYNWITGIWRDIMGVNSEKGMSIAEHIGTGFTTFGNTVRDLNSAIELSLRVQTFNQVYHKNWDAISRTLLGSLLADRKAAGASDAALQTLQKAWALSGSSPELLNVLMQNLKIDKTGTLGALSFLLSDKDLSSVLSALSLSDKQAFVQDVMKRYNQFLNTFRANGKAVTEEDLSKFFSETRNSLDKAPFTTPDTRNMADAGPAEINANAVRPPDEMDGEPIPDEAMGNGLDTTDPTMPQGEAAESVAKASNSRDYLKTYRNTFEKQTDVKFETSKEVSAEQVYKVVKQADGTILVSFQKGFGKLPQNEARQVLIRASIDIEAARDAEKIATNGLFRGESDYVVKLRQFLDDPDTLKTLDRKSFDYFTDKFFNDPILYGRMQNLQQRSFLKFVGFIDEGDKFFSDLANKYGMTVKDLMEHGGFAYKIAGKKEADAFARLGQLGREVNRQGVVAADDFGRASAGYVNDAIQRLTVARDNIKQFLLHSGSGPLGYAGGKAWNSFFQMATAIYDRMATEADRLIAEIGGMAIEDLSKGYTLSLTDILGKYGFTFDYRGRDLYKITIDNGLFGAKSVYGRDNMELFLKTFFGDRAFNVKDTKALMAAVWNDDLTKALSSKAYSAVAEKVDSKLTEAQLFKQKWSQDMYDLYKNPVLTNIQKRYTEDEWHKVVNAAMDLSQQQAAPWLAAHPGSEFADYLQRSLADIRAAAAYDPTLLGPLGLDLVGQEEARVTWYSQLDRTFQKTAAKNLTAEGWLKSFEGSVKRAEMDATGLADWLRGHGEEKIGREEVQQYINQQTIRLLPVETVQGMGKVSFNITFGEETSKKAAVSMGRDHYYANIPVLKDGVETKDVVIQAFYGSDGYVDYLVKSGGEEVGLYGSLDEAKDIAKREVYSAADRVQYSDYNLPGDWKKPRNFIFGRSEPELAEIDNQISKFSTEIAKLNEEYSTIHNHLGDLEHQLDFPEYAFPGRTLSEKEVVDIRAEYDATKLQLDKIQYDTHILYEEERKVIERGHSLSTSLYNSHHWSEIPGVEFWIRANDRVLGDGSFVLHAEEFQNDLTEAAYRAHNQTVYYLADKYKLGLSQYPGGVGNVEKEVRKVATDLEKQILDLKGYATQDMNFLGDVQNEFTEIGKPYEGSLFDIVRKYLPKSPYIESWDSIAVKRFLNQAAIDGYDRVTWTTGAQQFERWGGIEVKWNPIRNDADVEKYVVRNFKANTPEVRWQIIDRNTHQRLSDASYLTEDEARKGLEKFAGIDHGWNLSYHGRTATVFSKDDLSNLPGELSGKWKDDLWRQMQLSKEGGSWKPIEKGMTTFYDDRIPSIFNKLSKEGKWGVKVEDVALDNGLTVHSMQITPEMRDQLVRGMPLFQKETAAFSDTFDTLRAKIANTSREVLKSPLTDEQLDRATEMAWRYLYGSFDKEEMRLFPDEAVAALRTVQTAPVHPSNIDDYLKKASRDLLVSQKADKALLAEKEKTLLLQEGLSLSPEGEKIVGRIEDHFGVTDDITKSGFVTRDGKFIDMSDKGTEQSILRSKARGTNRSYMHEEVSVYGTNFRSLDSLYNKTGMVRFDTNTPTFDPESLHLSIDLTHGKLTRTQLLALEDGVIRAGKKNVTLFIDAPGMKPVLVITTPENFVADFKSELARSLMLGQTNTEVIKGATKFLADGRAVIYVFQNADVSTILHELAHVYRHTLADLATTNVKYAHDLETILKWTGESSWTVNAEEKFARAYERYLMEGKAPIDELRPIFAEFKVWMRDIYGKLGHSSELYGIDLSRKVDGDRTVKDIFDEWLGKGTTPTSLDRRIKQTVQDAVGFEISDDYTKKVVAVAATDTTPASTTLVDLTPEEKAIVEEQVAKERFEFQRDRVRNNLTYGNPGGYRDPNITAVIRSEAGDMLNDIIDMEGDPTKLLDNLDFKRQLPVKVSWAQGLEALLPDNNPRQALVKALKNIIDGKTEADEDIVAYLRKAITKNLETGTSLEALGVDRLPHPYVLQLMGYPKDVIDWVKEAWMTDFHSNPLANMKTLAEAQKNADAFWKAFISQPWYQGRSIASTWGQFADTPAGFDAYLKDLINSLKDNMDESSLEALQLLDWQVQNFKAIGHDFAERLGMHKLSGMMADGTIPISPAITDLSIGTQQWLATANDKASKIAQMKQALDHWEEQAKAMLRDGDPIFNLTNDDIEKLATEGPDLARIKRNAMNLAIYGKDASIQDLAKSIVGMPVNKEMTKKLFVTKENGKRISKWIELSENEKAMITVIKSDAAELEDIMSRVGKIPEGAIPRTNRSMIDYGSATRADEFMKNLVPFWMFSSRSMPYWIETMAENPWLPAFYLRYVQMAKQIQFSMGIHTSDGSQLPSLAGYVPIPGTDVWINLAAPFSMRYVIPQYDYYQEAFDGSSIMGQVSNWLVNYGQLFGISPSPLISLTAHLFGVDSQLPYSGIVPWVGLLPPNWRDLILDQAKQIAGVAGYRISSSLLGDRVPWYDYLVERRMLANALEQMQSGDKTTAEKIAIANAVNDALLGDKSHENNDLWNKTVAELDGSDLMRNWMGYFTGIYPKTFTSAEADFNSLRDDVNYLKDSVNNEIGSQLFGGDPSAEGRLNTYYDARYQTPEGYLGNLSNLMRYTKNPQGQQLYGQPRRDYIAEQMTQEQQSNAYFQAIKNAKTELDTSIASWPVGTSSDKLKPYYDKYNNAVNQAMIDYPQASKPWIAGYKPESTIYDYFKDMWFYVLKTTMPQYNSEMDYDVYQQQVKDWKNNLATIAASQLEAFLKNFSQPTSNMTDLANKQNALSNDSILNQFLKGTDTRQGLAQVLGMTLDQFEKMGLEAGYDTGASANSNAAHKIDLVELFKRLEAETNAQSYDEWVKGNTTLHGAIAEAWKQLYYDPFWNNLTGKSGYDREYAQQTWEKEHPAPTIEQLITWVKQNYPGQFAEKDYQKAATGAGGAVMSADQVLAPQTNLAKQEQDIWDVLTAAGPNKQALYDAYLKAGGSSSDWDIWYAITNGSGYKDPQKFQDFYTNVIKASQALKLSSPTIDQLAEYRQAQSLNDQFHTNVVNALGTNFYDVLAEYANIPGMADQKNYKALHPELAQYYTMKTAWASNNPVWAKYFIQTTGTSSSTSGTSGTLTTADIKKMDDEVWNVMNMAGPSTSALRDAYVKAGGDMDSWTVWFNTYGGDVWYDPKKYQAFHDALVAAGKALNLQPPTPEIEAEWKEAKLENDQFKAAVTQALGIDFYDILNRYNQTTSSTARKDMRTEYPQINQYYDLKDQWSAAHPIWMKYYNPPDTATGSGSSSGYSSGGSSGSSSSGTAATSVVNVPMGYRSSSYGRTLAPSVLGSKGKGGVPSKSSTPIPIRSKSTSSLPSGFESLLPGSLITEVQNKLTKNAGISAEGMAFLQGLKDRHPEWASLIDQLVTVTATATS